MQEVPRFGGRGAVTIHDAQMLHDAHGTVFYCNADTCRVRVFGNEHDLDVTNMIQVFHYNAPIRE